ncbi:MULTISPECIES: hypothetical protein [Tenacibaculum]|uniref:hypothetical protein n=1 Tax=Tenacibaculum TaxID=104267 RepID=UPI000899116B|nr:MULTISPECIES: hypothetical protein [unclassified Tenacibaculum]RBW54370.1 hypothetical protein DS884_18170 [Tenacibaculum sp. E3R01]SED64036.1 hypothetical protein SAMN04487765_0581 [Tenacibaculum sp. MAR_2010_89]
MKKQILNLGKTLNRIEQKQINGGRFICCYNNPICPPTNETSCIVIAGRCHYIAGEGVSC